jgi:probable phosphomutase (TIGR03848 family)
MQRLLLIRHAVTEQTGSKLSGWTPGLHLSATGREQAAALADRLARVHIDAIYSSPLERCQETAAAVAERHGLEVSTLDEVGEVRYGDWTGRTLEELAKEDLWRTVQLHPSGARFPGGESIYEMQTRAVAAIEALRADPRHKDQTVLVASHADVIKAVAAHYLGLHLDTFQRLVVHPASLTALAFGPVPQLARLNETGDNTDLVPPPPRDETTPGPRTGEAAEGEEPSRADP